jgi:hypothetical protein
MNEERLQKLTQRIAVDVFNLWWDHKEQGLGFQHVTGCLPAIGQSNPTSVIPVILERLRDESFWVREMAAEALEKMMARGARVFKGRRGKLTIRSVAELSR